MNKNIQFKCLNCGLCCKIKIICIYPFELYMANLFARRLNIKLQIEPIRKIIDKIHQKIIVFIYRLIERPCPFFLNNKCLIHKNKFIACRKYPISSWIDLGKTFKFLGLKNEFYKVDTKCKFIQTNLKFKKILTNHPLHSILPNEYQAVLEDKKVWIDLYTQFRILKKERKIEVINEYKLKKNNFNKYKEILNSWEQISAIEFLEQIKSN